MPGTGGGGEGIGIVFGDLLGSEINNPWSRGFGRIYILGIWGSDFSFYIKINVSASARGWGGGQTPNL